MENHHPSTLLSMDSSASSHEELDLEMNRQIILSRPPDINLPLSAERSPPPQSWNSDPCDMLDVGLGQQHDMENMYMWVFKERPENALGKMQLRSYMNGHSRQGERPFPFSVDKGFARSHRMQRKHYRGLSNPQCVHGIEVVPSPNLMGLDEDEKKRWMELTGRDFNFTIHPKPCVMKNVYGPVTAAKTIYEDEEGYLIIISLPFVDLQRVKVTWRNTLTHGIIKVSGVSTSCMPFIKRHDRTFKLTDPASEHCPPGEFVREIPLSTRIPEDANIEAYYDGPGSALEILVPKLREGPEEHEVRVCFHPHLGANDLMLT
ncbi:hypothetical protein GH714_010881 [Hevea brasiliensis]|uniref:SHSP domain-containing protein n=1 Tax=Hevea brasiliensis TaxID=3981 RepID=A0A6A6KKU0_HEVBR|nr:hypothetical protein GH714_010881 [Hevea brasiliensis]